MCAQEWSPLCHLIFLGFVITIIEFVIQYCFHSFTTSSEKPQRLTAIHNLYWMCV